MSAVTKEDYDKAVMDIIVSGRGYQAIADISYHLAMQKETQDIEVMQLRVLQNKIYDICEGKDATDLKKVKTIRAIVG